MKPYALHEISISLRFVTSVTSTISTQLRVAGQLIRRQHLRCQQMIPQVRGS